MYEGKKEPKGLGHAILIACTFIGDNVITSEEPCLKQMMKEYETYQSTVLGVQTVE